ncbi:MAG: hypothetical protein LWW78_06800 [Deltaproteobacteria bacterium]|nr:hypothetical protein [Deltaproteobacteria bacterium]
MVLILMLIAALIPALAIIFIPIILKRDVPIFVYLMSVIWFCLFFLGLRQLRYTLISGVIFASLVSIFSIIALIKGLNPFAEKGLPVCPFCVSGLLVNLAIVFLSFRQLFKK